ncbi:MAG TPA: STAS domain-containing protein [Phycisphaerales bacterium]|nr:STAS domain-containing protein [Phycisphaerales bacterium]
MSTFNYTVETMHKGYIVHLTGKAGGPESEQLETELNRLANLKPAVMVLDMGGLEYLSSMGISAIVRLHKLLKETGGVVRLAAVPPAISSILSAAHIDRLVPLFADVKSASA